MQSLVFWQVFSPVRPPDRVADCWAGVLTKVRGVKVHAAGRWPAKVKGVFFQLCRWDRGRLRELYFSLRASRLARSYTGKCVKVLFQTCGRSGSGERFSDVVCAVAG